MHARIVEGQGAPDQLEALEHVVRRELLPALRLKPGFCGAVSLVDRDRGAVLLVLLWETEEEAADSHASVLTGLLRSWSTTIWEVDDRA